MELKVCVGSACHLKGSSDVVKTFQNLIQKAKLEEEVQLKGSFCMGHCDDPDVTVEFNNKIYSTTPDKAGQFFNDTVLPFLSKKVKK